MFEESKFKTEGKESDIISDDCNDKGDFFKRFQTRNSYKFHENIGSIRLSCEEDLSTTFEDNTVLGGVYEWTVFDE